MAAFDRPTFADAYAEAEPRLRRLAAALGFGAADVDDVLQEVYVELLRRPGEYRTAAEARGWLTRVGVNICLREYRRRERFGRAVRCKQERDATRARGDEPTPEHLEELARMRAALRELPGEWAVPLVLRYFCECDATQIGALLELPPATVRGRLRQARLWLADRLAEAE